MSFSLEMGRNRCQGRSLITGFHVLVRILATGHDTLLLRNCIPSCVNSYTDVFYSIMFTYMYSMYNYMHVKLYVYVYVTVRLHVNVNI